MAGSEKNSTSGRSSGGSSRSRNELWSLLTEYFTPCLDCGVTLPSGPCGKIHVKDKRVQIIVERRDYLHSSICSDKDCETKTETDCETKTVKVFYKDPHKKGALEDGFFRGRINPTLVEKIRKSFINLIDEFASTVKPGKEENTDNLPVLYETDCDHCDKLIYLLEFGKITALNQYTKEEYDKVMSCKHGGQAVGHNLTFFMYHMVHFFLGTKLLLYNNVENAPLLSRMFYCKCDGQTFMPYARKKLDLWMKDLDETTRMCKASFRCIYLYVYFIRKFEPDFKIESDWPFSIGNGENFWLECFRC